MISSLLSNLSSALARVFVIGIVPLLAFLLLHGLVIDAVFPAASRWMHVHLLPEFKDAGLLTFAIFLGIITVAYVWSSLSVTLRQILEGKCAFCATLSAFLGTRYVHGLRKALRQRDRALVQLQKLTTSIPEWQGSLQTARIVAQRLQQCTYVRSHQLTQLLAIRDALGDIDTNALDREVRSMVTVLQTSSADLIGNPSSTNLDADLSQLRRLAVYSRERWSAQLARALERVESDFAGQKLTATKMGNIAQSVSHYAEARYGIRLDVFWSRLQEVISKDERSNAQLEEANTQLDFVVSLFWQTLFFTLVWVIVLPIQGHSRFLFLVIAIGGAVACMLWYSVALQNYRALASIMRAAIDLHRHALLDGMNLPVPRSLAHERALWNQLEQHVAYGNLTELTFKVDQK